MTKQEALEQQIKYIFENFGPADPYQRDQFHIQLCLLVNGAMQTAQEPYVREYRSLMDATLAFNALTPKPIMATEVLIDKADNEMLAYKHEDKD